MKRQVVIEVRGGLVQGVYVDGDPNETDVRILDWDTECVGLLDVAFPLDALSDESKAALAVLQARLEVL